MNFELTEEQIQLKNTVRDFMQDKNSANKQVENWLKTAERTKAYPREGMKEAAKLGLLGLNISEEYGGAELNCLDSLLAFEEIAYFSTPFALNILVQNSLVGFSIDKFGNKYQKEKYLPRICSGEFFGCFANTEPDTGSDAKNISAKAEYNNGKWILNGRKRFITNASVSGIAVVFARTSDRKPDEPGITAFLIKIGPKIKGFSLDKIESKEAQLGSTLCEFSLDNYETNDSAILGEVGRGWNVCDATFKHSRSWIAMQGVALAQRALDEIVVWNSQRTTFGKPIIDHQYIAFELSKLKINIELARMMAYKAAWQEEVGDKNFWISASMAKYLGGEIAVEAARKACQFAGGISASKESIFYRLYLDSYLIPIYEGASEIQLAIISKTLKQNDHHSAAY